MECKTRLFPPPHLPLEYNLHLVPSKGIEISSNRTISILTEVALFQYKWERAKWSFLSINFYIIENYILIPHLP